MKILLITIIIMILLAPIVLAADNFTTDQVQGVFGQFTAVLDEAVAGGDFSTDNVQGVFGQFVPVLDEAAGTVASSRKAILKAQ